MLCLGDRHQHCIPPQPALRLATRGARHTGLSGCSGLSEGWTPIWNLNHVFQSGAGPFGEEPQQVMKRAVDGLSLLPAW